MAATYTNGDFETICINCGACANKREDVKHYEGCKPGDHKKWKEYYAKEEVEA